MVCPQCPLFRTKPGTEPPHITASVAYAMNHEAKVQMGYRLSDEDRLTPIQWSACHGLIAGRARFDEWRDAENREEIQKNQGNRQ